MSRFVLGVRCAADRFAKFRTTRPRLTGRTGKRLAQDSWKSRPLNSVHIKPLSDDEIRKELRGPGEGYDPYQRLEFFTPEDLEPSPETDPPETAMPIKHPDVVPATKAREEIIRRLDRIRTGELRELLDQGRLTQEDIDDMYRKLQEAQEDSSLPGYIDQLLHGDDQQFVEYPKEGDELLVDRSKMSFVEQMTFDYNIPSYVEFEVIGVEKEATIPVVRLSHCNGEEALVSLHGGCILDWVDAEGRSRLFQNPEESFDGRKPIRSSGVSLAFPQFGRGVLPYDGVVNGLLWDVVRSEVGADWLPDPAPSVTLFCKDNEETRKIWPHSFEIFYKITLGENDDYEPFEAPTKEQRKFMQRAKDAGTIKSAVQELEEEEEQRAIELEKALAKARTQRRKMDSKGDADAEPEEDDLEEADPSDIIPTQLRMQFAIRNTGDKPMEFMCACRTHLTNRGLKRYGDYIRILGLGGRFYLDYNLVPGKPILRLWNQDYVILGERDMGWEAIFTENKANDVFFCPGRREYYETISRSGFPDILLSQPGPKHPENHHLSELMTMLGRGCVSVPVVLKPGEKWEGEYVLRHHDRYFTEPIFGYQGSLPPPDLGEIKPPIQETMDLNITDLRS